MAASIFRKVVTLTIASGQSLSAALPFGGYSLERISMPAAWDAANLTFQASADDTNFGNVYDSSGTEYTVTAAASREIIVPVVDLASIANIKIRSGTNGTPVTQSADRVLTLTLCAWG